MDTLNLYFALHVYRNLVFQKKSEFLFENNLAEAVVNIVDSAKHDIGIFGFHAQLLLHQLAWASVRENFRHRILGRGNDCTDHDDSESKTQIFFRLFCPI